MTVQFKTHADGRSLVLLFGIAFLLNLFFLRIPILTMDEAEFLLAGEILRSGGLPYRDFVIHHPPMIYFLYRAGLFLSGPWSMEGVRLLYGGLELLTLAGVIEIARRLFPGGSSRAIVIAGALFLFGSHSMAVKDVNAGNVERFCNFWLVYAFLIALVSDRKRAFCSGALTGLAILTKQQALLFAPVFWLLTRSQTNRTCLRSAWLLGAILPLGLWTLLSLHQGFFFDMVEVLGGGIWDYLQSGIAVGEGEGIPLSTWTSWNTGIYFAGKPFWRFAVFALMAWPLTFGVLRWRRQSPPLTNRVPSDSTSALVCWVLWQGVGCFPGLRFFWHYFLLLVPPLALLAAGPLESQWRDASRKFRTLAVLGAVLPGLIFLIAGVRRGSLTEDETVRHVAAAIASVTSSSDRVFIWGFMPVAYVAAKRLPATRYLQSDPLSGLSRGSNGQFASGEIFWKRWLADVGLLRPPKANPVAALSPRRKRRWDLWWNDLRKNPRITILDTSPTGWGNYGEFSVKEQPYRAAEIEGLGPGKLILGAGWLVSVPLSALPAPH